MWHNEQQFNDLQNNLQQAAWLKQYRQEAWNQFQLLGYPTQRDETWKYTNIRALQKREFTLAPPTSRLTSSALKSHLIPDCYTLVFENGQINSELSQVPATIVVANILPLLHNDAEIIKPYLNQLGKNISHGFSKLNTALFNAGVFIKISANTQLDKPLHCLFITTQSDIVTTPRHMVVAEINSKACIIEDYLSLDSGNYFTNTLSELFLAPNSKLGHIKIQRENTNAFHIGSTLAQLQNDSELSSHVISKGSLLSRSDLHVNLAGTGASCDLNGLYWISGKQHCDHHTRIEHQQAHCHSKEFYKGLINDTARAVFNGQIYVHPGAIKSHAELSNKNLLLSPQAEIDTKPQLEIYNDDVKCSHGTTIGQLDDNELFYLRSRGLDLSTAKDILTYAFADEVIEKISLENIRVNIRELFLKELKV